MIVIKMSREETGIVSPMEQIRLNSIIKRGWDKKAAQSISDMMVYHSMSIEDSEKTYKENMEWV